MRYFIVTYLKKPSGQMDEEVSVSRRIRTRDLQTASVILDFEKGKVVIASMEGVTVPKDFLKIRDFYSQHYKRLIDDLESIHGRYEIADAVMSTDTEPRSH
jgi:hypothetical protein